MDAATLRTDFPEFADTTAYPDAAVNLWLGISANLVSADRWGGLYDTGVALFTCHNLVLERQATKSAATGAVPGVSQGPVSAKSIDKVSVSYDVQAAILEGGGDLNLTVYGTRFYRLALMMGSGGYQVC